jgi:hypothetical protein
MQSVNHHNGFKLQIHTYNILEDVFTGREIRGQPGVHRYHLKQELLPKLVAMSSEQCQIIMLFLII